MHKGLIAVLSAGALGLAGAHHHAATHPRKSSFRSPKAFATLHVRSTTHHRKAHL